MTESPLTWTDEGQPRSRLYGDIYFSPEDGLAETRAVFLQGCGLPDAWAGRQRFVVGELGFGTGLNIAALLELWRTHRPADGRLHIFSIEAHPVTAEEARRALACWPELAASADLLTARWPGQARGLHRVDLPELNATLDLAVADVADALDGWRGRADAWFLDGFSPALNPQMWAPEILQRVADRSAPGARAATFTVAGAVRRGLADAGFVVDKRPGFGRKRERLEAVFPGEAPEAPEASAPRVAVVGAGIAGAAMVRALSVQGLSPVLIDAEGPGAGASGNPAALVTPRLDAGLGAPARLFAQAFRRAVQLYDATPGAVITRGVLQLAQEPRDGARFAKLAQADLFEPASLTPVNAIAATVRLGEPVPAGLDQTDALTVAPARVLDAWTTGTLAAQVDRLERTDDGWLLHTASDALGPFDAVVLAGGAGTPALTPQVMIRIVRGQASWVDTLPGGSPPAAAWGGYATSTGAGLLFGATHDRGDTGTELRPEDHDRNLTTLAQRLPILAARVAGLPLEGRAGLRATTGDHLPLAGALQPGLFVLGGLGGRGFSFAPLLAEHLAALITGAPSPLPGDLAALVDPERFAGRIASRTNTPPTRS